MMGSWMKQKAEQAKAMAEQAKARARELAAESLDGGGGVEVGRGRKGRDDRLFHQGCRGRLVVDGGHAPTGDRVPLAA